MATHDQRKLGAARRAAAICLAAIMLAAVLMSVGFAAQAAAASATPAAGEKATASPKVHALMTSLAQEWLEEQGVAKTAPVAPAQQTGNSFDDYVNSAAGAIHDQIVALARAIPKLPHEFERAAGRVTAVDPDSGRGQVLLDLGIFGDRYYVATRRLAAEAQALLNLAVFGAFGFGAEWLFRKMTGRVRRRVDGLPMETVKDRLRVIAARFALAFGAIAAFVLGSLGPFFALDWDPARREMVLGFLIVFVVIRAAMATGGLLFAPDDERFRIIPTDTVAARFWCRRLTAVRGLVCARMGDYPGVQRSRLLVRRSRTRRLHARPGCRCHSAGSGLAQTHRAPRGRRSTLSRNAPFRPRCRQHSAVDRHRIVVGVLGCGTRCHECAAGLLARSRTHHPAARHLREPARRRASAQTPRFVPDRRSAQRHRSNSRTRYPGPLDHRCGGGARLGLGCRSRAPRRPGHIVRPHRPRRADHRRHPADRRRALARCEGRDRSASSPKPPTSASRTARRRGGGRGCTPCCRFSATFCLSSSLPSR